MQAYCPAQLSTGPAGELRCTTAAGAAVGWTQPPVVDWSAVSAPFSAGFILVASCWALGHGVSMVIDLVRR